MARINLLLGLTPLETPLEGKDKVVDVGLEDDVLGLCLGIGESTGSSPALWISCCCSGVRLANWGRSSSYDHSNRGESGCLGQAEETLTPARNGYPESRTEKYAG